MSADIAEFMFAKAKVRGQRQSPSTQPRPLPSLAPSNRWAGAAINSATLAIQTICVEGRHSFFVDRERSANFVLERRDQAALNHFSAKLQAFLERSGIRKIYLKIGPARGPRMSKADAFLCEASLYLTPALEVRQVSAFRLGPWMRANDLDEKIPTGRERPGHYALATACFVAEEQLGNQDLHSQR